MVALKLQQFQYTLKKIFLGRLCAQHSVCFLGQVMPPPPPPGGVFKGWGVFFGGSMVGTDRPNIPTLDNFFGGGRGVPGHQGNHVALRETLELKEQSRPMLQASCTVMW